MITQLYERYLTPCGVTLPQRTVMKNLGSESHPVAQLAKISSMDRTTLRRLLDPLERRNFVVVAPGIDRRVRFVSITERGRLALSESDVLWKNAQRDLMHVIGEQRWETLVSSMQEIRQLLSREPTGGLSASGDSSKTRQLLIHTEN